MLTYPSDSLPQIACPMDEDAIPPNPFCSVPPHSEPPPPLLPLPSITPSCESDGTSRSRRSGRIQGVRDQTPKKQSYKDSGEAQRPSRRNPSPARRERESSMVQVSQCLSVKLPRVSIGHLQQVKQNKRTTQERARESKGMLTYPSDSLPQIACPMDEDAIPPNPFCSVSPHSEPPPPLLPLPSITPSCESDGTSRSRRSGRIQGVRDQTQKKQSYKDSGEAQRPSRRNPSPARRERESSMVQVSQCVSVKLPRVSIGHLQQVKQNKDIASECSTQHKDQKSPMKKANISATQNVDKQLAGNTTQDLDAPQSNPTKSHIDPCGEWAVGHAVENPSAAKGWMIGPLFQSLKSKMASFTEIVMTPVKLFTPNSPPPSKDHQDEDGECELHAIRASSSGTSEPSQIINIQGQRENGNEDSKADQLASLSPIKVSDIGGGKNLKLLDVNLSSSSAQVDECALTETETNTIGFVPLQHSLLASNTSEQVTECNTSVLRYSSRCQPPDRSSASHESKLKSKPATQPKPLPRKRRSHRQKGSSMICPSEVNKEACDPGANGGLCSHRNSIKRNHSDSRDTGKPQSLPSIAYYTPDDDDDMKIDDSLSLRKSPRNTFKDGGVNESGLNTTLDTQPVQKQQVEWELKPDSVTVRKAKRRLKLTETSPCNIEPDLAKRKRSTASKHADSTKNGEVLNAYSDSGVLKGFKPPRNEVSTNALTDMEIILNPSGTRVPASTGTKRKAKGGHQTFATLNEAVLQTETENPSGTMVVCSLDHNSAVSEIHQQDCNRKRDTSGASKRLKKTVSVSKFDELMNIDNMETTITSTLAKETQEDELSKVSSQPLDATLPRSQSTSKAQPKYVCQKRDVSGRFSVDRSQSPSKKKPLKRNPPNQSSIPEVASTLVSTSLAETVLLHREESWKTGPQQLSKRPKNNCRRSVKSSVSGRTQVTEKSMDDCHEAVEESQSKEDQEKMSVHLEMTPDENNQRPVPPLCQPCLVELTNVKHVMGTTRNGKKRTTAPLADEVFPSDAETTNHSMDTSINKIKVDLDKAESCTYTVSVNAFELRHSARRVKNTPRRKCRVLHSKTPRVEKEEEEINSITREEVGLARPCSSENISRSLLRSYSCPEIPSILRPETPWSPALHSPQHGRIHPSPQHHSFHIPPVSPHKSPRRTRRHTVCSVEVAREIAPLCLRKEVYPSRRSTSYGSIIQHLSPNVQLSPSTSLAALASFFLSSPLAFLSKKFDNRGAATSSHLSSPPSSSGVLPCSTSPSRSTVWHHPGFLQRTDTSAAAVSPTCSVLSSIPSECESETRPQSEEEEYGEDTSCSSREFEDVGLREEKALSDSEIKVVKKHEERGKVSSIRIRKTLPKPQNNLTPMGLPRPIRLKKKEFSLEEIYTNKNFTKPPESRLETIFEIPLSRRNGDQLLCGHRRLKRFVEFPEVGVARKPKKPLVGAGRPGPTSSLSRPRRGSYHNPKDTPSISGKQVDSLLCAKLDQLDLWLLFDQNDS